MKNVVKESKKFRLIDLIYIGMSSAIITVCAWITIPVGSIPITLQTMAVFIVAGLFGAKRGVSAVVIYLLLGAMGMPVFSGFRGGLGVLAGTTGGYAVGFIFTALVVGIVSDKAGERLVPLVVSMVVGMIVCYAFGTLWFYIAFVKDENPKSVFDILVLCVFPYIIPDAIKIAIGTPLVKRLKRLVK